MFKKLRLPLITVVILSLCLPLTAYAKNGKPQGAVMRVLVNGVLAARVSDSSVSGTSPYIPVRAVCERLGAVVRWDDVNRYARVTVKGGTHIIKGVLRDGSLMAPAESVAEIFNINMKYEPSLNTVSLNHGPNPSSERIKALITPESKYNPEDIYWLSRIVEAEARGENYESRLAVANVVLNRKASGMYPATVKGVIFDKKHGVQFTPVSNGSVYNDPSGLSFLAALDALDGYNNVPGALFFMDPRQAKTLWIEDNREMAFTVGAHTYYY